MMVNAAAAGHNFWHAACWGSLPVLVCACWLHVLLLHVLLLHCTHSSNLLHRLMHQLAASQCLLLVLPLQAQQVHASAWQILGVHAWRLWSSAQTLAPGSTPEDLVCIFILSLAICALEGPQHQMGEWTLRWRFLCFFGRKKTIKKTTQFEN
jgi:hypothetical protein